MLIYYNKGLWNVPEMFKQFKCYRCQEKKETLSFRKETFLENQVETRLFQEPKTNIPRTFLEPVIVSWVNKYKPKVNSDKLKAY